MRFIRSIITKTSRGVLPILALATCLSAAPSYAQDAGIMDLHVRRPWERIATKEASCQFTGTLNRAHALSVLYDQQESKTRIRLRVNKDVFVTNRLYQADVYVDFDNHFASKAVPVSPDTIELIAMDTNRFSRIFNGAQELSFGIDETLYVINLARIAFPLGEYQDCIKAQEDDRTTIIDSFTSLNPFKNAVPVAVKRAQEVKAAELAAITDANKTQPAEIVAEQPKPKKWRPFLTSHRPEPYRLKPDNAAQALADVTDETATPDALAASDDGQAQTVLSDERPPYREIVEYNQMRQAGEQSCGVAGADGVYEFSQIPEAEMPPAMKGLRNFMTGNDNQDEDKELIQSLLVQLQLLEKEKEALRQRVPEGMGALSVIRSCNRERESIADLRDQLRASEDEKFDIQKRHEIQSDIIDAYEDIEGDNPPPPAPEESE